MSWRYLCKTSKTFSKTSWRRFEDVFADVLKMSWRRFCKTSWRWLENVLKMSWRRMAKTNILVFTNSFWRRREDVFWRRKAKANIFVLIKTSWRRLQYVFWRWRRKTSSSRRMLAGISNWQKTSIFLKNLGRIKKSKQFIKKSISSSFNWSFERFFDRFDIFIDLIFWLFYQRYCNSQKCVNWWRTKDLICKKISKVCFLSAHVPEYCQSTFSLINNDANGNTKGKTYYKYFFFIHVLFKISLISTWWTN